MDSTRGNKAPYALLLPLPTRSSTGWPPACVSVTANKLGDILRQVEQIISKLCSFVQGGLSTTEVSPQSIVFMGYNDMVLLVGKARTLSTHIAYSFVVHM
jgi:hypothetical protein